MARTLALALGLLAGVLVATQVSSHPEIRVTLAPGEQVEAPGSVSPRQPVVPPAGDAGPAPTSPRAVSTDPASPAAGTGGPTASTPGSVTTSPATSASPGAPPPSPGTQSPDTEPVRGVTAESVRIGIGVIDIGALAALGPGFDAGDGEEHMRAWLDGVRSDGLLPIHGRDLEFTYRTHGPSQLDPPSQRASCQGFVQDDQVSAVVAPSQYHIGAECVARQFDTPLLTSDALSAEAYQRSAPFLFTLQMSLDRLFTNWIHWAHAQGILAGKTIGVYSLGSDTTQQDLIRDVLEPTLARFGQRIAVHHSTDQSLGGPQDSVAVQRFRTEGVDLALLLTSKAGFMQQAQAQRYRPTYLESDYNAGTNNTATSTYPPEQWDGTRAMSGVRWGWVRSENMTEPARACSRYFEQRSGRRFGPEEREAEWIAMQKLCDSGWVLLEALRAAGPDLTPESFVSGLHAVRGVRLGVHLDVSFWPDRYDASDQQLTTGWSADCGCWSQVTAPGPLWVD